MSQRKKKPAKLLSDTISELLLPQPLLDPEVDPQDETTAKEHYYEEDEELSATVDQRLSAIRKGNVKLLQDVDRKYSGKVASRKDFELDDDDEEEEDDSSEEEQVGDEEASEEEDVEAGDVSEEDESDAYEESEEEEEEAVNGKAADADSDSEAAVQSQAYNEMGSEASADEEDEDEDDAEEEDEDDDEDESDFDAGDFDLAPKKPAESAAPVDANPSMKPSNLSADIQKGNCIQNQLHIWEKLLEIRIHSQKVLIKANTLPAFDQMNALRTEHPNFDEAVRQTESNVDKLLSKLTEMQSLLVAGYPETKDLNPRKRKTEDATDRNDSSKVAKYSDLLTDRFTSYTDYRNTVLLKWHDRTKVLTPGSKEGKHAAQHNILQNISGILANRSDLIRRTQLHKGGYEIIGAAKPVPVADASGADAAPDQIHSGEIYDDTDFYHTQLRELIEFKANSASNPAEMDRQFVELQKLRKKMKKAVDTRASKGRKIRYVVHNKMVNFMARNDTSEWTDEAKNELYSSLFGARVACQ